MNALRAFESVARLGSFISAADELCVTPAAISQQIKSLETWLGLTLFDRHAQGVSLNDAGRQAVGQLTKAFDLMGDSVSGLLRTAKPHVIKIATLPSVAQYWLAPRLNALRHSIPNLEISVTTRQTPPNLKREPFNLSLFLTPTADTNGAICLAQDEIFPVCAPELAKRLHAPADLLNETLLSDETWFDDWPLWLSHIGETGPLSTSGPVFSLFGLALEEAKNGAGVIIGHGFLVEPLLKRGELVAPFSNRVTLDQSLCLEIGNRNEHDEIIETVVNILTDDLNATTRHNHK